MGPRLEQKFTSASSSVLKSTLPISTVRPCVLDCGPGGGCHAETDEEPIKCLCPLGRGGDQCERGKFRQFFPNCSNPGHQIFRRKIVQIFNDNLRNVAYLSEEFSSLRVWKGRCFNTGMSSEPETTSIFHPD